ncbi:MAG: hypothetical protein LUE92_05645 [Clostridiales bacterium]|nr:hypothetical protein [Clostridiales bacterium]
MKRSIVIAQVGKLNYREAHYKSSGTDIIYDAKYSCAAVMREVLRKTKTDDMQLILVGTEDSVLGNVYLDFSEEISDPLIEDKLYGEKNPYTGKIEMHMIQNIADLDVLCAFEAVMSKKFAAQFAYANMHVKLAIIEYGKTQEELQENFSIIRKTVEEAIYSGRERSGTDFDIQKEEIDVYFDISNGFRSFPIYIYTLINYLSQIRDFNVRFHMYYGMFEAKQTDMGPNGEMVEVTPLVDLWIIDDMMNLIRGISEFRSCGSVVQIRELLKQNPEWDVKIGDNTEETLSYAFNLFDYGTNANNLAAIKHAIDLLIGMEEQLKGKEPVNVAEYLLLEDISGDFRDRFDTAQSNYPYGLLMIRLAEWYHMQGREGNAAIAAQEAIITYMLERYPDTVNAYLKMNPPKDFPKEGIVDFTKAENLFHYNYRNPVKSFLDNLNRDAGQNGQDEKMNEFLRAYSSVKNDIRNVMAHILLSDQNGEDGNFNVNGYRESIEKLICFVRTEIESRSEEERIFGEKLNTYMSGKVCRQRENAEKEQLLSCMLDNLSEGKEYHIPSGNTVVPEEFIRALEMLAKQLNSMKNAQDFDGFYERRKRDLRLLFCILDEWICRRHNKPSENLYKECFKTKNHKSGYIRLVNFMKSNKKAVLDILEYSQTVL